MPDSPGRIPCKTSGCQGTILPSTAAETGGYCMPCVQREEQQRRNEFIRANRKDFNPYAGVVDPVEIIKLIHVPRKPDPLVNVLPFPVPTDQIYSGLDNSQVSHLLTYAGDIARDGRSEEAADIAIALASWTSANLDSYLEGLIQRNEYYPGILFRGAGTRVRDRLIERVESRPTERNHILIALAWVGDDRVVELFSSWRRRPPAWSGQLHVPPETYSHQAGWELDGNSKRRNLFATTCHALERGSVAGGITVEIFAPQSTRCEWCGQPLLGLLECDLPARMNFANFPTGLIRVPTCSSCSCFAGVFTSVPPGHAAGWFAGNVRPAVLPSDAAEWPRPPRVKRMLAANRRLPQHASEWGRASTESQIGGLPTWIQDAEYPRCPGCKRTMFFFGQVVHNEIEEMSEGIFYAFLCSDCGIACATYQQS